MNRTDSTPAAHELAQLHLTFGPGRILAYHGQRRLMAAIELGLRVYVAQRQAAPLASWETVLTTANAEHAAQWLRDASLPSTDAYAAATGQTGELVDHEGELGAWESLARGARDARREPPAAQR